MENSGLNFILGAAMVAILLVTAGMGIYNGASKAVLDSAPAMSTLEKESFNNQFEPYSGYQTGSKIKALMGVLIANSNTYEDEPIKIPKITVSDKVTEKNDNGSKPMNIARPTVKDGKDDYVSDISKIRNWAEEKHTYYVEFNYTDDGLLDEVVITYDK